MAALPSSADVTVNHKFVSGKADGADPTLVQPSKWNQNEAVGGGADGQNLVRDSGQTDGSSWINYHTASFTNNTGGAAAVGDVVTPSLAADSTVILDDTSASLRKFVVALQTPAGGAVGAYCDMGFVTGIKAQGAIPAGNFFRKSATTKAVEDTGVAVGSTQAPPAGALGFATTAAAGGFVNGILFQQTVASGAATVYTDQLTGLNIAFVSGTSFSVAIGAAASQDTAVASRVLMSLTSAITKTSAAWAVGSGNGGNASGVAFAASTWYHVFLIQRTDTLVVDVAFDTSVTGVNIAANTNANYTKIRRIGSLLTSGASAFLKWFQNGDTFLWDVPNALDVNTTNPGTAAVTVTSSFLPTGVRTFAILGLGLNNNGAANASLMLSSVDITDTAPSNAATPLADFGSGPNVGLFNALLGVWTNTSAQYRYRLTASAANPFSVEIVARGWIDPRGKGV